MNFSKVVIERMNQLCISRYELSKKTNLSYSFISDLIKRRRRWNEDTIDKVCEALSLVIKFEEKAS